MIRPPELSVQEVAERLAAPTPPRLLDVREEAEIDTVHLTGGMMVTQQLIDEIVATWDKSEPIICYCHHGVRSLNAARFLMQQGFTEVSSMRGGIDAWSLEIDPTLPRY